MKAKSLKKDKIQEEALSKIKKYDRCGVAISMGVGKTRLAIKHLIHNYNDIINVLVVIPKLSIADSWKDELEKMGEEKLLEHMSFTTYLSLNKRNPENYDIVYLDECHSLLSSHSAFLSNFTGQILGLTGTPPIRVGSEKYEMVNKYCPIVYEFTVDDATSNKILNDYKIFIHKLPLNSNRTFKKNKKNGGYWFTSELNDYLYYSKRLDDANTQSQKRFLSIMRMKAMMDYTSKEKYVDDIIKKINSKCIIFANTTKQADRMCQYSYHSKNSKSEENLQLFKDGRIQTLSCVLQLSEGVTIPNLETGIIMHAYGNERKSAQRIGRLLRLNPLKVATCHILCYENTVDENWVNRALSGFDQSKIKIINTKDNQLWEE